MLDFLNNLLGRAPSSREPASPFERLNEVAPLRTNSDSKPADATVESSFICREPVLDRRERIAGYEFLLEARLHNRLSGKSAGLRRAYDEALICNLGSAGVNALLGHRLAVIGISAMSLGNHHLDSLPADKTVLMIDPRDGDGIPEERLHERISAAKERGFLIGMQLRRVASMESILPLSDLVQLHTPDFDGLEIAELVRRLRRQKVSGSLSLIAGNIQSLDEFQVCFRAGCDYFHGPFVDRRESWHPPKSNVDRSRIAQVLHQLRNGVDNDILTETIRQDAVVTYKLLRYVNSPANGLTSKVNSVEQCLLLLGRERFYRWLSLLLFDVQNPGYTERILTEQALVRASLMERIGRRSKNPDAKPDTLFLTGLFSLLDQMLGKPLAEILTSVSIPAEVSKALVEREGPLAPFLALGIACEQHADDEISRCAERCGVDVAQVNQDMMAALIWANEMGEMGEQDSSTP